MNKRLADSPKKCQILNGIYDPKMLPELIEHSPDDVGKVWFKKIAPLVPYYLLVLVLQSGVFFVLPILMVMVAGFT